MKKLLGMALCIVMLLSIAACGKSEKPAETAAPAETEAAETEAAETEAAETEAAETEAPAQDGGVLLMATTTSTEDTGLLDYLQPLFKEATGIDLQWTAVGTGEALKMGEDGQVDIVLVHAKASEEEFVANGFGVERFPVMYNDFVIVGPAEPIAKTDDVASVFGTIQEQQLTFVSRGDDSGTDKKEKKIWKGLELDPTQNPNYLESGQGMGAEGGKELLNQYGVIAVNPDKFPEVNNDAANQFIDWITSDEVQQLIGEFGIDKYGQALFTPNAGTDN